MDVSEVTHRRLFDALVRESGRDRDLGPDQDKTIYTWELLRKLGQTGINPFEPRVREAVKDLRDADGEPLGLTNQPIKIDFETFRGIVAHGDGVIQRALDDDLALKRSEYLDFARGIQGIYADLLDDRTGAVADYIPTLRDADPDKFGITICTADGQTFSIGDTTQRFSIQSTSKVVTLALAYQEHGPNKVHEFVGMESSGGVFNDPVLSVGKDGRPANPMINAGAIGTLALVRAGEPDSAKVHTILDAYEAMTGRRLGGDLETYYAEMETGDGNRSLTARIAAGDKLMGGGGPAAIERAMGLYTNICALDVDATELAAVGATLANGGRAPFSGERVFSSDTAGLTLNEMLHNGFYDGSARFGADVGLPGKSGVSGNVVVVDPKHRMAIVVFSPRLDAAGNSARGLEVCRRLAEQFDLHPYKNLGADRGRSVAQSDAARTADTEAAIRQSLVGTGGGSRVAVVTNPVQAASKAGRRIGKEGGANQL